MSLERYWTTWASLKRQSVLFKSPRSLGFKSSTVCVCCFQLPKHSFGEKHGSKDRNKMILPSLWHLSDDDSIITEQYIYSLTHFAVDGIFDRIYLSGAQPTWHRSAPHFAFGISLPHYLNHLFMSFLSLCWSIIYQYVRVKRSKWRLFAAGKDSPIKCHYACLGRCYDTFTCAEGRSHIRLVLACIPAATGAPGHLGCAQGMEVG